MMEGAKPRFICILEPTGTWAVWDEQRNLPGGITEPWSVFPKWRRTLRVEC